MRQDSGSQDQDFYFFVLKSRGASRLKLVSRTRPNITVYYFPLSLLLSLSKQQNRQLKKLVLFLEGDLLKISVIGLSIFFYLFCWFLIRIYLEVDFTPTAASNTTDDVTSLMRSHIEHLIQTYSIILLIL